MGNICFGNLLPGQNESKDLDNTHDNIISPSNIVGYHNFMNNVHAEEVRNILEEYLRKPSKSEYDATKFCEKMSTHLEQLRVSTENYDMLKSYLHACKQMTSTTLLHHFILNEMETTACSMNRKLRYANKERINSCKSKSK